MISREESMPWCLVVGFCGTDPWPGWAGICWESAGLCVPSPGSGPDETWTSQAPDWRRKKTDTQVIANKPFPAFRSNASDWTAYTQTHTCMNTDLCNYY